MVGRGEEIEEILSALARPPAAIAIEGEAGIGKTRLVTELLSRAEIADRLQVTGACAHIREPFPLGPVVEALRRTHEHLSPSAATSLSPVTGALRPLLPELAHLLPAAPDPLNDRIGERHRVFRGLAELLGSLGRVVLVLEDMHWADEQTIEFLGYLLSDPLAGLCVVLTFRGEEVDPGIRALTARLPASVARVQVELPPFDTAATSALAAAVLGADRVSEDFAAYLRERTSGLPFAIQQSRVRLLPARVVTYLLLAACLFTEVGYRQVWSKLTSGLYGMPVASPSGSALRQARQRLGPQPMQALFDLLRGPAATTAAQVR
ncbi:AAA family ATPase [Micromonospora sp. NPDC050200]|uniref:AAA family ATPase n=1 Tax=Micromonospora sp. NPDC050200 TaxID=3155664 RepID=UPI0033F7B64A